MDLIIDFDQVSSKQKLFDVLKILKGKKLIKIEKYSKKRSNPQNRYYRGVILKYLSDLFGYFDDEMHEVIKLKFLPYERVNRVTGEIEVFGGSTAKLNTIEFEELNEKIRTWALVEYDCLIPLPNEIIE